MKRFLLLTMLLVASFVFIFSALIGVARLQPIKALLTDEIKICGEHICARNVSLSKTTLGDAEKMLDNNPDVTVDRNYGEVSASLSDGTLIFSVAGDDLTNQATVGNLEVDFWSGANTKYPTLGDFITHYGPPCKVMLDLGANTAILYYPHMYLLFEQNDGNIDARVHSFSPYLPVGSTLSYDDPDFCTRSDPKANKPWKGFMTAIGYEQHP